MGKMSSPNGQSPGFVRKLHGKIADLLSYVMEADDYVNYCSEFVVEAGDFVPAACASKTKSYDFVAEADGFIVEAHDSAAAACGSAAKGCNFIASADGFLTSDDDAEREDDNFVAAPDK
jgi:hypothetical protein